jgi:hypothetical protein
MAQSKTPKDVLELGRVLVKQSNLESEEDMLGRWMAHHIAELIAAVDVAPQGRVRAERAREASAAIVELWRHRSHYENRINPLLEFKPIVQAIATLDPAKNVWAVRGDGTRNLYDTFRRLITCLLLRKAESLSQIRKAVSRAKGTARFQTEDERQIAAAIHLWLEGVPKPPVDKASRRRKRSKQSDHEVVNFDEIIESLISEARKALDAVAAEIAGERTKETARIRSR